MCKVIDDYVTKRNAAANQARDAQVAADAPIAQQLHEAQQKVASAQAMATAASADHAASLLVIEKQKEVLKRRHDQEDAEIAKKRLAEDTARANARRRMDVSTNQCQQITTNAPAPMSSTPNRHVGFQPDFSLIDPHSTFRRYDTTGNGGTDSSMIPNTVDAWIFKPFEPVSPMSGGGDAMVTIAMLAKASTFTGEARDWPMFIQTVKSMIHDIFPSDVQRLTMLSTMLAAPIRVGMSQIFNTPQAYRAAL